MLRHDTVLLGWFEILFFGLCLLAGLAQLHPGCSYLQLDREGFTLCSLFRRHRFRWEEIEGFYVVFAGREMVGWKFSAGCRAVALFKLNRAIAGCDAALPDTYGMSAEELASLMNQWRNV